MISSRFSLAEESNLEVDGRDGREEDEMLFVLTEGILENNKDGNFAILNWFYYNKETKKIIKIQIN
jgi:hypothetical protein